jgi:hypothetical protein
MKSKLVELTVDVKCDWGGYQPSYRIYVDNELLTERTYLWNNKDAFIREHIVIDVCPGEHTLRLEKCGEKWIWGDFRLEKLTIDGEPADLVDNRFVV